MLPAFRAGIGGRIGSGSQGTSWISLDDVVGAIHFLLQRADVVGPVNATAPQPLSNAEYTRVLGRVLRRPTWLPVPEPALRGLLGQVADEVLLAGAYVHPDALVRAGFQFLHPDLESALRLELGRLQSGPAIEHT
jgi:NAD dependent epimerase/dehydratase family enzyme